jgi:Putative NADP-dependent oxidoreductases
MTARASIRFHELQRGTSMSSSSKLQRAIVLNSRPVGAPTADNFRLRETPLPVPADGQLLLRTLYLSLDPYMRGRMSDTKSYAEPVGIGEVMVGGTVSRVEASKHPHFRQGDLVLGFSGWQDHALSDGGGLSKLDPQMKQPSLALGVLGMPGFTAYMGLLDIGQPKAGETVVVAAASGAVGSVVGQIAKLKGCRSVGIAGGTESAAMWSSNWVSMPASITTVPTSPPSWRSPARKASMCILKTSAARYSTRYCRCSTPQLACRSAASSPTTTTPPCQPGRIGWACSPVPC